MLRVAIVDDDPDMRELVRRWATRDGHRVVAEAADGAEGIEVAGNHRPDVLVLDIEMPLLDGCHAIPGIHRTSPSTVIVVFSSCVERRDEALAAGANTWATKAMPPMTSEMPSVGSPEVEPHEGPRSYGAGTPGRRSSARLQAQHSYPTAPPPNLASDLGSDRSPHGAQDEPHDKERT